MTKKQTYVHIAPIYDLLDLPFESGRYRPIRRILFQGVHGTILDAGVGTGRNMPFYPANGEVVGIDLSPHMLAQARKRKASLGITTELRQMDVSASSRSWNRWRSKRRRRAIKSSTHPGSMGTMPTSRLRQYGGMYVRSWMRSGSEFVAFVLPFLAKSGHSLSVGVTNYCARLTRRNIVDPSNRRD